MATTVNASIRHKRGTEASMPTLKDGQIYLCSDTHKVYKGTSTGENILICNISSLNNIENIINSKQDKLEDSGWNELVLENGTIPTSSYTKPIYRKIGKFVEIIGAIKGLTTINNSNQITFATLPSGYRSCKDLSILCHGSGKNSWLLTVDEAGYLKASRYGANDYAETMTGDEWLPFHVMYIAKEV